MKGLVEALADLLLETLAGRGRRRPAERAMTAKITPDHLGRGAVIYVRQSTMGQVAEDTESQPRQC
jgi:hypothetical protein